MVSRGREGREGSSQRVAGRYRVERALARGGMGIVFEAVDESTGEKVALKRTSASPSSKELALFEREYHTLAGLRHPHVVEVYDYGTDERGSFYTMELLSGGDLSQSAPMPWEQTCSILRDVASALALVHARRLLHRDISPRNVWRLPDGRVKLIDFGTLAAFGTQRDVVGTPPFIAPEALHGQALDQRADLFSLGALGYWLLTGRSAFPARELHDLPELWRTQPPSPSSYVASLARPDLPPIPAGVDALIEALLSRNPLGRPTAAGAVIDRLVSVARLEPEPNLTVVEGFLGSAVFVGRSEERALLVETMQRVLRGKSACVSIEAPAGQGRTRLLNELALEARLKGFVALHASAERGSGNHATATALALRALDAQPKLAKATAMLHAPTLAHLSAELAERLGVNQAGLAAMPQAPGEARMRIQGALRDWFLALARAQPLAILIDDAHLLDEASAALFAALAMAAADEPLLLSATVRSEDGVRYANALESFRQRARRISLAPLALAETRELVHSVFGEPPNVARTTELLQRVARGNPAHIMELTEFLVRSKLAIYVDGTWMLPQGLQPSQLPATRDEALVARLERLSPSARELAQLLSVHEQAVPLELCAELSELEPNTLFTTLEQLVRDNVLSGAAEGYRFSHDVLRRTLAAELDPARAARAHRILGEHLLGAETKEQPLTTLEQLEAGVHLLQGGAREQGSRTIGSAALRLGLTELTELGPAAPWLARALALFRAERRSEWEQVALLAPLALAGYYADRRYAERFGDEAVTKLARLLQLPLAVRLRRFLGGKLALFVAIANAALRFKLRAKNPRVPKFREALVLLFNCVAALSGVAIITIDPERAKGYAKVIEPLTALGKNHVATLMHEFCLGLAATVQDRIAEASARWSALLERLEARAPIENLPDNLRVFYLAGALYARGVIETWRDDSQALAFAERLDGLQLRLYEMSADQIRMMYYGNQGNMELFERFRARVELHAIQRGTAWQVETWAPGAAITIYLRTYDAARMRHSEEQLRAFAREIPSLGSYAARARGVMLLLRGELPEACAALECVDREQPLAIVGWARSRGALARACNELGQHERARAICLATLQTITPGDLAFTAMNSILLIELALADAGLGDIAGAEQQLDALIDELGPHRGPLTLGSLHEARTRVALLANDPAACELHLAQTQKWYGATHTPSLLERYERLARRVRRECGGARETSERPNRQLVTLAETLRRSAQTGGGDLQWALAQILAYIGTDHGVLYARSARGTERASEIGSHPQALDRWVAERLAAEPASAADGDDELDGATITDDNEVDIAGRRYRLIPLRAESDDAGAGVVGGLILGSNIAFDVHGSLQRALASRLMSARDEQLAEDEADPARARARNA